VYIFVVLDLVSSVLCQEIGLVVSVIRRMNKVTLRRAG